MNDTMRVAAAIGGMAFVLLLSGCAAASPGSSGSAPDAPHPLEGTWQITWTADELYEALGGEDNPTGRKDAELNDGRIELTFEDGMYDVRWVEDGDGSCPGTYDVEGERVVMTATTDPTEWDCGDGLGQLAVDARWTVEDGQLTFTDWRLSPAPAMDWFYAAIFGEKPLEAVE